MKTKYEASWDSYSDRWKGSEGESLGDEWGTDTLTKSVFERYLEPNLSADATVLEIGPGGGKYSVRVAPRCARLICADVSKEMLRRTKERLAGAANLETRKLDGFDFAGIPDRSIDFAFSIDVFVHLDLEDVYAYLREFRRVLRDGSRLVLHFANFLSWPGYDLFLREADFNRAQFKSIGRISFQTPEILRTLLERLGWEVEAIDTETSPRDFLVMARKSSFPDDPRAEARASRIVARAGGGELALDLVRELRGAVRSAPDPSYIVTGTFDMPGDPREIVGAHPPAFVGYAFEVPRGAVLRTAVGIHPEAWARCSPEGVQFRVAVREANRETELFEAVLRPRQDEADRGWREITVALDRYAGRPVLLVLETRIPPGGGEFAWAGFGEPAVVVP